MATTTALIFGWTFLVCVFLSGRSNAVIIEANERTSVTLPCKASGDKSRIQWTKTDTGDLIRLNKRAKYTLVNQAQLKITNLLPADGGTYVCSREDRKFNEVTLVIKFAPVITNQTENLEIEENNFAVMSCLTEGNPPPRVTWHMAQENLHNSPFLIWTKLGEGSTINVTMPCSLCNVKVQCTAENQLGNDSRTLNVAVQGKPEVSVLHKRINHKIGDQLTLRCLIKFLPKPLMNWKKNGVEIWDIPSIRKRMNLDFDVRSKTEIAFILSIKNLKKKDFGTYKCIANNKYGNSAEEHSDNSSNRGISSETSLRLSCILSFVCLLNLCL
ncbi:opioid-binding protein/cell adhesion molecule homolog [Argonauta hians]